MGTPRATYRLQLNNRFGFAAAARVAPYLAALGISHVYTSPYLKARPGSQHGYDIVAHDSLNPELGSHDDFIAMAAAFRANGLGLIADIVPNHMGVGGPDNPLWLDVLEWGADSSYAGWFDIDWDPQQRYLQGKVLVPFLADQYGLELDGGKLELRFDASAGEFAVWAYDTHRLPINPLHYGMILGNQEPELEILADDFAALEEWRPQVARRADELKQQLATLIATRPPAHEALQLALRRFNGGVDGDRTELDALIQQQHWRTTHYRVAGDDINYRRFFDINELAGLRVELPEVFEHTHALILGQVRAGIIDGLRVDHVDGLLDPTGYLERLRDALAANKPPRHSGTTPYLIVEKILCGPEQLPAEWPVDGTTGYDFCGLVQQLLIDSRGAAPLSRCYERFTGDRQTFEQAVRDGKQRIMNDEMAAELNVLARDAARIARQSPRTADFTRNILQRAIRAFITCLPVYRFYVSSAGTISDGERAVLEQAMAEARRIETGIHPSAFEFLSRLLTGDLLAPHTGYVRHKVVRCARRLQQYSGPVMAKGLEDTALYRYNRCIALNEVGSWPSRFGIDAGTFHRAVEQRRTRHPDSMLSTSTHDTKRGEDARARLMVLAELPAEWDGLLATHTELLLQQWTHEERMPEPGDLYLLLQMMLGSWPAELLASDQPAPGALRVYAERLQGAVLKSAREARRQTSWMLPNPGYEAGLSRLVEHLLTGPTAADFITPFLALTRRVAALAVSNSLAQTLLKLTLPGVPDFYQGSESWNLDLVDPDNRRPVDFAHRERELREVRDALGRDPADALRRYLRSWHDGRVKLALILQTLTARRQAPEPFGRGDYVPLEVAGPCAGNVCAFARLHREHALLVAVRRFPAHRATDEEWRQTCITMPQALQGRPFRNWLTGVELRAGSGLPVQEAMSILPVAGLIGADGA